MTKIKCATIMLAVFAFVSLAQHPTTMGPSKEQIWRLIPKSFDGPLGTKETQDIKKVINYGPPALPILAELLREHADVKTQSRPTIVSMIIDIATQVEGDHEVIITVLRDLLTHPDENIRICALRGLGEMGRDDDSVFLLPLMNASSEVVRVNATLALGKIGNKDIATKMKTILHERKTGMRNEDIRRDAVFAHGYQAVSNILFRHGNQELNKQTQ